MSNAWDEWVKKVEESSFTDKIRIVKDINDRFCVGDVSHDVWKIGAYGYLMAYEKDSVYGGEGEYYVYLWKHAWGDPFYVGSGKNDRWLTKNPRCDDFYLHLDQADAVVYKILEGVDLHTSRLFEKYVSVNLVEAGYTLANGDNNPEYMTDAARARRVAECGEIDKHELAPNVQREVLRILNERTKCDYRVTDTFLRQHGTDYFSRNYIKKSENSELENNG